MTSELKANEYISEFVSGGTQNYGYKLRNSVTGETKTVCKVRGIKLKFKASQFVNFETIKHLVLYRRSNSIVTVHTDKNKIKEIRRCLCIDSERTRGQNLKSIIFQEA